MAIKYVFFDCWDTLITYKEAKKDGDMELLYQYINEKENLTVKDLIGMRNDLYSDYYSQRQYEVPFVNLIALLLEGNGLSINISYEEFETIMETNYVPTPIPGILEFLNYLKSKNIRCSVLSNTTLSESFTRDIIYKTLGPDLPFEFVVCSSRVGAKKPNPRFFLLGAKKAKVDPESCLYIGDQFIADCYGSSQAKMQPVWFNWKKTNSNLDYPVGDYLEIESYQELINILEMTK